MTKLHAVKAPDHTAQILDLTARIRERQAHEHRVEIARATLLQLMACCTVAHFEIAMKRVESALLNGASIEADICVGECTPPPGAA